MSRVIALGLLALAACEEPIGVPDFADGGYTYAPPECGALGETLTNAACGECARASCCAELAACSGACEALLDCRAGCLDGACAQACEASHPQGVADLAALDDCTATQCEGSCATSGICSTSVTIGDPNCDACLGQSCCAQLDACLQEEGCSACIASVDGVDCDQNSRYTQAVDCFAASCAAVCDG